MNDALGDHYTAVFDGTVATPWPEAAQWALRMRGQRGRPRSGRESLTPTEHAVVEALLEGLTNPQIAERLFMSRATVKTHLNHIFTKLEVATRAELAAEATRRERQTRNDDTTPRHF